jgi:hypothetical protein
MARKAIKLGEGLCSSSLISYWKKPTLDLTVWIYSFESPYDLLGKVDSHS